MLSFDNEFGKVGLWGICKQQESKYMPNEVALFCIALTVSFLEERGQHCNPFNSSVSVKSQEACTVKLVNDLII